MEGSSGTTKGKKAAPSYRRGKWTAEEEAYSSRLITEFKLGLLPLTDGTTLRTFLSKLLNCDPMRISKKFVGQNCIGKQVFRRRQLDIDCLTPEELDRKKREISELEKRFLERVAQTNRAQRNERNGGLLNKGGRLGSFISEDGRAPPWMVPPNSGAPGPGEIKAEGGGVAAASSKPPAQKTHMRSATWNPHPHLHSHSHSHSREMMPSHQYHHSQPSPSFGEVGVGAFADLTPAGLPPMSSSTSADWGYFPGSASGQAVNPGNFGENYLYYESSQGQRSGGGGGGGGEGTAGAGVGATSGASMGGIGSSSGMYRVTSLDLLRAALGEHEGEGMGDNMAENSNSLSREKPINPCGKTKRRVTGGGDGGGSVERHGFRSGIEHENENEHEGASGATSSKSRSTSPSNNGALPAADDERQKKAPRGTRSNADNSSGDATSNADSSSVHSVHSGKTNMGCADSLAPPASSSSSFTTGWVGAGLAGPGAGASAGASNITPGFARASGFVSLTLTQPHLDMHEKRIAEGKRSGSTGAGMGGEGVGVEPKAAGAAMPMPMPMQVQYVPSAPPGFEGLKRNSSVENFWLLVNMGDLPKPDSNTLTESFEGDNPASATAAPTGPGSTRAAAASSAALSTLSEAALAAGGGPDALTTHDSYAEYQQQMIIQQYRMQKQLQTDPCLNSMYDNFSGSNVGGGGGGGEWNRPG